MKSKTYSCFPRFPKKDKQVVFCIAYHPEWDFEPSNTISIGTDDSVIYIHSHGKEGLQSIANALQGLTHSVFEQLRQYDKADLITEEK